MINLKRKVITGIATTAILLNALAPMVFADTSLTISGNGADSNNNVEVKTTQTVTVQQSNDANVHNNVDSNASSGSNEASSNTGGNVTVDTGNAGSTVNVGTTVNSNQANVQCNTCGGNATVTISGNGVDSHNSVDLSNNGGRDNSQGNVNVVQTNNADVHNNVDSNASTGYNEAERNTGGNVDVSTGNATSNVTVSTMANANAAIVAGSGSGSTLTADILGNGVDSRNEIELDAHHSIMIWQTNEADVHNNVDSNAKTGGNEAERNTGGNVTVSTGDATANTTVNNKVNFNSVDADCGCEMSITAKIAGNGVDSNNTIEAEHLSSTLGIYQGGKDLGNNADLWNQVGADAKTGYNEAESNTAAVDPGDPVKVMTGNANSNVTVSNTANENVVGPSVLPLPGGANVNFNFDLAAILAFLHISV